MNSVLFIWGWSEISRVRVLSIWRYRGGWMKILRDPCSSFQSLQWRRLGYLVILVFLLLHYHEITITLRSYVVVLSVTQSCGYSRGDVRLILDGWLVEEYRVLRDSMLHELSRPLSVTHFCKFKSQVRVVFTSVSSSSYWVFSISCHFKEPTEW